MPAWEKTKHGGKAVFDKGWAAFEKLGGPVNKLTNKIGSEAFWPTGLGPESDKAARILKSFCKDGFYKEQPKDERASPTTTGPKNKPKVLVKIPQKVIQNCVGLAIFSVWRTGLWVSAAGGSGVLIARKEDGSWGPPSGILIHTVGVGFMAGMDVYDCVLVINNREALDAFSKLRVSLGGEVSVVAGPLGAGGVLESELYKNSRKPVFSYVKSRGLYGGLQVDGTIIVERNDENANFYGERLPINDLLAGKMKRIPPETHMLMEVLKQADGRTDVDHVVLEQASHIPPPGDVPIPADMMSEDQKHGYAPPPHYDTSYGAASPSGYAPSPAQGPNSAYAPPHDPTQSHGAAPAPGYAPSPTKGESSAYVPPQDSSIYDAPEPLNISKHSPPPGKSPMRTDSGFAPPPGPPPHRTDSGFAAPPPRSPKRDPDGPPSYQ